MYQSKKDKTINCVKVCFLDNKISIKYYSHESPDNIFLSDRIFNNKEIEQFRGWKTKYNDKI